MIRSIGAGKMIVDLLPAADLEQRLQVAQLQRDRVLLDHDRRVLQPLGGLELALGVDDLRAALALGLGLARHRPLHARRDLDVLHLDGGDLDAPWLGRLVDDLLEDRVDLLALREQLVEHVLPEHRAQRRLRVLRRRDHEVLDLHDRVFGRDDAEVRDGVDPHRHVVLGDDLLRRDVQRDRAEVDLDHPVDDRDQQEETRALRLGQQPAEPEDDPALVLARNLDRRDQEQDDEEEDDGERRETGVMARSLLVTVELEAVHRRRRERVRPARAPPSRAVRMPELAVDEDLAGCAHDGLGADDAGGPTDGRPAAHLHRFRQREHPEERRARA